MNQEENLLDVIEQVHAAALDGTLWPQALDSVADIFGAVGVSFELVDKRNNQPFYLDLSERFGALPHQEYLDYFGDINIRLPHILSLPAGEVDFDFAFLSETEIDADEFYADFLSKYDLRYFISGNLLNTADNSGVLAVHRSIRQGHVDEKEIGLMQRFLPHMQQAIDMRGRLEKAAQEGALLLTHLDAIGEAVLLLDGKGTVLHANSMADDVAAQNDGITVRRRKIAFSDGTVSRLFDRILTEALVPDETAGGISSRNLIVHRPSGLRPYLVSLRSLPSPDRANVQLDAATAIVFIRDPETFSRLDAAALKASYNLSPTETDLAVALDRGGVTVRDIAGQRGVSVNTMRGHLYSLMGKVGVGRQTDLVRLLRQYRQPF